MSAPGEARAAAALPQTGAALSTEERERLDEDLRLILRLNDREPDADLLAALRATDPHEWFALDLSGAGGDEACGHLAEALAGLPEPVTGAMLDELAAEFAAIHLTFAYRAAPTESVWRDEEGLERQAAMFDVRRWYARHGLTAPDWRRRSDDHLVNELQFLAFLLRRGDQEEWLREAALFLRDHLLVWVPGFAGRVASRCRLQFFAGAALVTALWLDRLALLLGTCCGLDMTPPAARPPAHGAGAAAREPPACGVPSGPGW